MNREILSRQQLVYFLRYGAVGAGTNLVLYVLFLALLWIGVPAVFSAGLCYVLGVALSYLLNRAWTFSSDAPHGRDLPRFLLAYGVGLAATLVFITVLVRWLPEEIAQLLNIFLTALVIYTMLRLLRFGQAEACNAD